MNTTNTYLLHVTNNERPQLTVQVTQQLNTHMSWSLHFPVQCLHSWMIHCPEIRQFTKDTIIKNKYDDKTLTNDAELSAPNCIHLE